MKLQVNLKQKHNNEIFWRGGNFRIRDRDQLERDNGGQLPKQLHCSHDKQVEFTVYANRSIDINPFKIKTANQSQLDQYP